MERKRNQVERLKIDLIDFNDEPIKEQDSQLYQKLRMSVEIHGQLKNIVVCKNGERYECLEGSKTVKILRELNEDEVLGINLGELSQAQKNLVKIEISRDYFLTNYVMIGRLLKQMSSEMRLQDICNTVPFDVRQAEHLIQMTEFDWEDFAQSKQNESQVNLFDLVEEVEGDNSQNNTVTTEDKKSEVLDSGEEVILHTGNIASTTIHEVKKTISVDFSKVEAAIQKQDWLIAKFWINDILDKHPNNEEALNKLQTIKELANGTTN